MDEAIVVVTTVDSLEAARAIADAVLTRRLGACAQIAGPIESRYWWQGKIDSASEFQCIIKTSRSHYPALEKLIREHHPYQCPEILATPVVAGFPGYLDWLRQELAALGGDNG